VLNDKEAVEKMLNGQKARVHGYAVLVVGEGIEKPEQVH
jgi:translation elongation factor EF-Ts